MGGRTRCRSETSAGRSSFNPRPRGGANQELLWSLPEQYIEFQSTPPWGGERKKTGSKPKSSTVSIFAPVGGRTSYPFSPFSDTVGFNPRPRGGANPFGILIICRPDRFQSTPPWGANSFIGLLISPGYPFHSTPPWGGELLRRTPVVSVTGFNPRPRGGANFTGTTNSSTRRASFQSTPPWGGELTTLRPSPQRRPFQSTPPWGGELPIQSGPPSD